MQVFNSQAELLAFVGRAARSPESLIEQALVDSFAEITGDRQWIHTDPQRAERESTYGGTIAHAMLTLSLLPKLYAQTFEFRNRSFGLNYGFDKVRIPSALRCGQLISAALLLVAAEPQQGGVRCTWDVTVTASGAARPAIVARWLTLNQYQSA